MKRARRAGREAGQAALGLVLALVVLLTLGATTLAATSIQHDPLVQRDVIQHLAYRALQSGEDSYLAALNNNPNLINCNSSSTTGCSASVLPALDTWVEVPNTSSAIPEYYMWTNPQLCFTTNCVPPSGSVAGLTLQYAQDLVYGAAGIGSNMVYEKSIVNVVPENGFLTHIFWDNYNSSVPAAGTSADCTYNWNNDYYGPYIYDNPNTPGGSNNPDGNNADCNTIYFGPSDILIGPVYSNDSIYVSGNPNFGTSSDLSTVTTHDPNCLFVDDPGVSGDWQASNCSGASADVGNYNTATSSYNAPFEPIPSGDSQLGVPAAADGCEYSGPTVLSFYKASSGTEMMDVWSPDTPTSSTDNDGDNSSTNTNTCIPYSSGSYSAGGSVVAPVGTHGNGVIYVQNTPSSQTCVSGANPYDGSSTTTQVSSSGGYGWDGEVSGGNADCEGDAFVSNANSTQAGTGGTPGISGAMTVASQNDTIVTGNLTYNTGASADCGSTFTTPPTLTTQCAYNPGSTVTNDVLGLIAYAYVDVNEPVYPSGAGSGLPGTTMSACTSSQLGTFSAALCDPANGGGLTIDAAILALNDDFGVNNHSLIKVEGTLTIYGSISEDYRGAVGTFNSSTNQTTHGYSKYYLWDSRLDFVTVPSYLSPGTPAWAVASSAVSVGGGCPSLLPNVWSTGSTSGSPLIPSGSSQGQATITAPSCP